MDKLIERGDFNGFNPVNSVTAHIYKAPLWTLKYYIKVYFDNDFGNWIGKTIRTVKYSYSKKSFMMNSFTGNFEDASSGDLIASYSWMKVIPNPITDELEFEKKISTRVHTLKKQYYDSIHMFVDDFDGFRREKIKL
jgi:hypothetical protein